ncbi:putative holin-like toxin [Neobacillus niacini]|uniref:putative holin-like toxin n=1 Tax=Neobacillus niacini TaxID=86668 RepID=UPI00358EF5AB
MTIMVIEFRKYSCQLSWAQFIGTLPNRKGVMLMTVFETLMITIAFASLIVAVLSFKQK